MARLPKFFTVTAVAGVVASAVALVGVAGPAAAQTAGGCQSTSKAVLRQNIKNEKMTKELLGDTGFTPVMKSFTPEPTSTRKFTGYETITVRSPKGTTPVVGSFALTGAQKCSVVVTSAQVVLRENAYVVKLEFPGEQGNPGKLRVTLISR